MPGFGYDVPYVPPLRGPDETHNITHEKLALFSLVVTNTYILPVVTEM